MYHLDSAITTEDLIFVANLKSKLPKIMESNDKEKQYYVLTAFNKRVGIASLDLTQKEIEVNFVIAPEDENLGYGKVLIDLTLSQIKKVYPKRDVFIYIQADNYKAHQVLKDMGFNSVQSILKMKYEGIDCD